MITLKVSCSKCGKELHPEMDFDSEFELNVEGLRRRLDDSESNWIVEVNGDNIDTYCSKVCAG